jgi:hypothetical protein
MKSVFHLAVAAFALAVSGSNYKPLLLSQIGAGAFGTRSHAREKPVSGRTCRRSQRISPQALHACMAMSFAPGGGRRLVGDGYGRLVQPAVSVV